MERLSEKLKDVLYETIGALSQVEEDIIKAALERLAAYEETGLEPEEVEIMRESKADAQFMLTELCRLCDYDRLEELAHAEKEGRLVVLPCKFGDSLYRIRRFKRGSNWRKEAVHILSTTLTMNNVANVLFGDVMGKTVFLSREEAEAALEGGKADA